MEDKGPEVGKKLNMTRSAHPCIRCGSMLWKIEPDIHGWEYYCQGCKVLTAPPYELADAMRTKDPDALGIVFAIPCKIEIVREGEARGGPLPPE
jgi:hypothetical protein